MISNTTVINTIILDGLVEISKYVDAFSVLTDVKLCPINFFVM